MTKNLNVLIVDDEPIQRKIMREYCTQSCFFEKIEEAKDGIAALGQLQQSHYDLILLDINMPLFSGLSLAKSISNNTKVIFITAYAEHAVEAFELNVVDYLMKPVSFERFLKAIQKVVPEENASKSKNSITPLDAENKIFISLKKGKKILKIKIEDILYCEAKGNNTYIHLTDNIEIDIYTPLSVLLSKLPPELFTQVHRSFIVNNKKVKAAENSLLYIGSVTIPVGANYKDGLQKIL